LAQPDDELIGVFEVAEMAGVTRQVVTNWRTWARDFPQPVAELHSGPAPRRGDRVLRQADRVALPTREQAKCASAG